MLMTRFPPPHQPLPTAPCLLCHCTGECTQHTHSLYPQLPEPSSHLTPLRCDLQSCWTSLLQGECLHPLSKAFLSDNNVTATYWLFTSFQELPFVHLVEFVHWTFLFLFYWCHLFIVSPSCCVWVWDANLLLVSPDDSQVTGFSPVSFSNIRI